MENRLVRSLDEGELLQWARLKTYGYEAVKVDNLDQSWFDGLAFCALIHSHNTKLIPPYDSLLSNTVTKNLQLVFEIARVLGIRDDVLEAKDLLNAKPRDVVLRSKITAFLLELNKHLTSTEESSPFSNNGPKRASISLGRRPSLAKSGDRRPSLKPGEVPTSGQPEWVTAVKKMQAKRLERKIPEKDVIRCQRIIRKYLAQKKSLRFKHIVLEFRRSPQASEGKKRNKLCREIIDTEKSFLAKLIYVVQKYKVPLTEKANKDDEILPESDIKSIFGNIEDVKSCSKQLLLKLNSDVANSIGGKGIGHVFLAVAPLIMESFTPYILNFEKCVETYNRAVKVPAFVDFERECERDPRGSLLNLTDILIMPVQRLPRYQLLFEQLLKLTPKEHVEYATISEALQELERICVQCNKIKREHELMEVMWDLKVFVEKDQGLVEIITPVYLDWTAKEIIDRLKKKVPNVTADYGLYIESKKQWMEKTDKLIQFHEVFEKNPESALLFQRKSHYTRKSRSLPKSFVMNLFGSTSHLPSVTDSPKSPQSKPTLTKSISGSKVDPVPKKPTKQKSKTHI